MAINLKKETRMLRINVGAAGNSGDPFMVGPLACVLITDTDAVTNIADCDFGRLLVIYDLEVTDSVGGGIVIGDVIYYDTVAGTLSNNAADKEYGITTQVIGAGLTLTVGIIIYPGIEA